MVQSIRNLGHYGDVLRVKVLFNKKDSALIQLSDALQAQTGNSIFFPIMLLQEETKYLHLAIKDFQI